MSPREYTLHRIVLLGLDIKAREESFHNKSKVDALRSLYIILKADKGNPAPHFLNVRQAFFGLDLIHFDRILIDEVSITSRLH
jgi:hypothetical protein